MSQFEITSYRRGDSWVVLFAHADLAIAGGGIEYTTDAAGERIIKTVGGP